MLPLMEYNFKLLLLLHLPIRFVQIDVCMGDFFMLLKLTCFNGQRVPHYLETGQRVHFYAELSNNRASLSALLPLHLPPSPSPTLHQCPNVSVVCFADRGHSNHIILIS